MTGGALDGIRQAINEAACDDRKVRRIVFRSGVDRASILLEYDGLSASLVMNGAEYKNVLKEVRETAENPGPLLKLFGIEIHHEP